MNVEFMESSAGTFYSSGSQMSVSNAKESTSTARSDDSRRIVTAKGTIRLLTGTIDDFISFFFSRVPEVNRIFVKQEGKVCHVWIFVDRFSEDVLDKICDREESVIDEFAHSHFDFAVVYQPEEDRNTNALGTSRQVYLRKPST